MHSVNVEEICINPIVFDRRMWLAAIALWFALETIQYKMILQQGTQTLRRWYPGMLFDNVLIISNAESICM